MSAPVYTLADLLSPQNLDAIRARFLGGLQGAGFPALTEWVPKAGVEMSFVDMFGSFVADKLAADLPGIVGSGFLGKAPDIYADLLAEAYLNTRVPATKTTFNMELVVASTAGPYTWQVGDVEIKGPSDKRYRNTNEATGAPGEFAALSFEAVEGGAAYADDPALCTLVTTFAGVTIRPAAPTFSSVTKIGTGTGRLAPSAVTEDLPMHSFVIRIDVGGDPGVARWSLSVDGGAFADQGILNAAESPLPYGWDLFAFAGAGSPGSFVAGDTYTFTTPGGPSYVQGSDAEATADLMARCRGRWSTLSLNPTDGLFLLWARLAYQAASRVQVSPDLVVAGRTLLTIADSHGPLDPEGVARVTAYIAPKLRCILDGVQVSPAAARIVTPSGAVLTSPLQMEAVQATAEGLWIAYLGRTPLGGILRLSEIVDLLMDAGAQDVTGLELNGDSGNLRLATGEVPVAADTLANLLNWVFSS